LCLTHFTEVFNTNNSNLLLLTNNQNLDIDSAQHIYFDIREGGEVVPSTYFGEVSNEFDELDD